MTTSEYKDVSCRVEKASKIRQEIIALEDLIEAAKFSNPIEDDKDQFIRWARGKIQELKQQFKEL